MTSWQYFYGSPQAREIKAKLKKKVTVFCDHCCTAREAINKIKKAIIKDPISLETPVTDDLIIADYLSDKTESPEEKTSKLSLTKNISSVFQYLDEREQKILQHRFGINGVRPKTLEQIGNMLGFSKERIRQLEGNALKKLRNNKNLKQLEDFLSEN